jgi:hypothetical protein
MNRRSLTFVALALIAAITGGVTLKSLADGGDERLAKAPKAVQESVKKLVGENKISGFGTEKTLGMTVFVVEVEAKNGREYAFGLDPDGTIAVRWVGLDPSIVPAEVIDAAKKAHQGGKIGETTICNVRNKLVYSLENKVGNVTHQMQFAPDGTVTYDEVKHGGAEKD